jgi:hypothetical protein
MTFNRTTRTFSWTPPVTTLGKTFKVKFIVMTESGGTDVVIDKLTVQPCCLPPEAMAVQFGPAAIERPNPTSAGFSVSSPAVPGATADLTVFDLGGRQVATVRGRSGLPLVWSGNGGDGRRMPNGVYLYRLRVAGHEACGRIVVVR